jgi:serine/threonine protein kinase
MLNFLKSSVGVLTITGPNSERIEVQPNDIIGRQSDCEITYNEKGKWFRGSPAVRADYSTDHQVSRKHAQFFQSTDGRWFVRDYDSKNGVFVNEKRISNDKELFDGSRLRIGKTQFRIQLGTKDRQIAPAASITNDIQIDRSSSVSGSEANIYIGSQTILGTKTRVAVKIPHMNADPVAAVQRLEQEFHVLSNLQSEHIIRAYSKSVQPPQPYLTLEFCDKGSIRSFPTFGRWNEKEALSILKEVAFGLAEIHQKGYVHRDLKPDNILVAKNGKAKIIDFGLAIRNGETTRPMGSVHYMSPESFQSSHAHPSRDIYALGCTIYEFLAGICPFEGSEQFVRKQQIETIPPLISSLNSNMQFRSHLPAIIEACLMKHPDSRPNVSTLLNWLL